MRYLELPKIDGADRAIRVRPDRVDMIDEIIEEYETEESVAAREEVMQANREQMSRRQPTNIQPVPDPIMRERKVTLVYIQGRRDPKRVATPANEIEDMLNSWTRTGDFREEADEDEWPA